MKCDVKNLLLICASKIGRADDPHAPGYAFMLDELAKHLTELGQRNDLKALDEFLELYNLKPAQGAAHKAAKGGA